MKKIAVSLVPMMLATATATAEPTTIQRGMPAPNNALELVFGLGFAEGTGELGGDLQAVGDVASAGAGLDLAVGWRATPNLMVGGYTNLSGFGNPDDSNKGAVTFAAGIKADWHFLPAAQLDPWISIGTGVKLMGIEDGDRDRSLTGVELAKLQVGLDYRVSPSFAIAPTLGVSATRFNNQYDKRVSDDAMPIADKQVNWTFSAGLQGRFDR